MKRIQMAPGGGKMTILMFQLEGNDQTLQDGIKTITGAIDGMVRQPRALAPAVSNGTRTNPVADITETESETQDQPEFALEASEDRAEARRSIKPPKVLPELKVPAEDLKKFLQENKVPEQDNSRYIALAMFLRDKMSTPAVTMDHIYTCYRLLSWKVPKDASQPLRRLKNQGYFEKTEEPGAYALNHLGENFFQDMSKG